MILYMGGKLAPNSPHFTRGLVKYVPGRGYFRAVPSQNEDKLATSPTPPIVERLGYQFYSKMCQRLRGCHPIIITLAHPENRRGSSYLRAQRMSRRGEDVILTQCPARYEKI